MSTQLLLVAVGRFSPQRDEIICGGNFGDTWHTGIEDSIDAIPADYPKLFSDAHDAYHMGIADRDLALPSRAMDYADRDERAAYVAGRCSTRRVLTVDEMLAELEDLREAMDDEDYWRMGAW